MVLKRILLLLLLFSMVAIARPEVGAQAPPTDEEFLQLVSERQGIPRERLRMGDRVDVRYPVSDVLLHTAKVLDTEAGKGYLLALDTQHNVVDLPVVAAAEDTLKQQIYGKLDPRLHELLQQLPAGEKTPVMLWLDSRQIKPDRSLSLQQNLAAHEQALATAKRRIQDALTRLKAKAAAAKYGPIIFAQLDRNQISLIAASSDIVRIFGADTYRASGGSEGTTAQTFGVWTEGNTGGGTVKPAILDPSGISDLNPYLNNATHAIQYWCAAVSSTCPNGKNIGNHATEMAGIVGSTHPLIRGAAPSVQAILSANSQDFTDSKMVQALEWARANGGDPINVSWSTDCGGYQTSFSRYLDWVVRNLFATVIVAAGNHPTFCPTAIDDEKVGAPGVAWNVITVGSTNDSNTGFWSDDSLSNFSDWRNPDFATGMEKPEVVAVGEGVRTTSAAGGDWLTPGSVSGTSYATAQVAGQVGLMLSRQPGQNVWPETNKAAVLASAFHDIESGQSRDGIGSVMMNISDETYRLQRYINDSNAGSPLQTADFPRRHFDAITLQAGERVRLAIAWDSDSNGSTSDKLGADLDLCVRHPDNQTIVACSVSYENAWELVEFTAPATGNYDVLVDLAGVESNWPGTFMGVAWSTYAQLTPCSGAIEVPSSGGTYSIDTRNGPTFFDSYNGWSPSQSGRERILKLTLDAPQDLRIADTNPNLDLHLVQFASCSSDPIVPAVTGSGADSLAFNALPAGIYYLIVDGANGAVGSTTLTISDQPPPAAPSGLTASAGDSQVSLSWSASDGAASYNVKRSTTSGGPYTTIASPSGASFTDTGLANGTTYYYVVSAVNSAGESANSNEASALPQGPVEPVGAPIKSMTFEEGTLDGDSGADIIKGTVLVETAAPLKDVYSARVPNASQSYLQEEFTGVNELYTSFYIKLYALPPSSVRLAMISNSGTVIGNFKLRTDGALQLRVGSNNIGAPSAKLATGTVYRVGIVQKRGSGNNAVLEGYLAQGDTAFGAPFASTTSGGWTSQATRVRVGATNSDTVDAVFDNIKLDAVLMP